MNAQRPETHRRILVLSRTAEHVKGRDERDKAGPNRAEGMYGIDLLTQPVLYMHGPSEAFSLMLRARRQVRCGPRRTERRREGGNAVSTRGDHPAVWEKRDPRKPTAASSFL